MLPRMSPHTDAERHLLVRYEVAYAEWLAAEGAAGQAEAAVREAMAAQPAGGPAASVEQWETALRLRALAECALDRALRIVRSTPL